MGSEKLLLGYESRIHAGFMSYLSGSVCRVPSECPKVIQDWAGIIIFSRRGHLGS